ncbi:MAG: hypothetical protein JWM47_3628, partial [Acidimicrobiales bacterium]|nr:hypothetical protein [Acidimicrobiales bacterium]
MIGGACVFLLLATSVRAEKDDRPPPTIGHVTVLPLVSVGVADLTSGHLPELVELMEHGTSAALATRALFAPTPQLALDRLGLGDAIRRGRVRIGGRTSAGSTLLPDIGSKARTRVDYLRDVNRAIARERAALPPDTILVVIGLPRSPRSFVLTPLVVFGPGIPTGQFVSASTRRTGIATPQDLSATVARIIGTPDPAGGGLAAAPLRISPGPSPIGVLAR